MARRILDALTARLSLVAITVDGENPYEIFESLNWKGLPLEEADLIRKSPVHAGAAVGAGVVSRNTLDAL